MKKITLTVAGYSLCATLTLLAVASKSAAEPMTEKARCSFVQQRPGFAMTTTIRLSHAFSRDAARLITSSALVEVTRAPARPGQTPSASTIGNDDLVVLVGPTRRSSRSGGGDVSAGYIEVSTRNDALPFLVAYHPDGRVRGIYTPAQSEVPEVTMTCVASADARNGSMRDLARRLFQDMQAAATAFGTAPEATPDR